MHIHPPSFREQRLSIGVEAKTKKEMGKVFELMNEADVELVLIGIPTSKWSTCNTLYGFDANAFFT